MKFNKITDFKLANKVVFVRTDMNVPIIDGQITDDTRIKAGITTLNYILAHGGKVIVATHLGRPTEGVVNTSDQVLPIAVHLSELLHQPVKIISNWQTNGVDFIDTNLVMLENVRCNIGEKNNSDELGQAYARLCDIFCYDAFATAHRAEASTNAIGKFSPTVCAGLLMSKELSSLSQAMINPRPPVIAIVAGSKVSTKLAILKNLADKVDILIVGGGILNTFLLADGQKIGKSLVENDLIDSAKSIMLKMRTRGAKVPMPHDVVVAQELTASANARHIQLNELKEQDMILDIGSDFAHELARTLKSAGTIIWNGPLGVFEFDQFARGTQIIAQAIAESSGFSIAGGGDTIAAINKFAVLDKINYVSTAGGALLEFLEGKKLPALTMLEQ